MDGLGLLGGRLGASSLLAAVAHLLGGGGGELLGLRHRPAPLGGGAARPQVLQHVVQPPIPLGLSEGTVSDSLHAHRRHVYFSEMPGEGREG